MGLTTLIGSRLYPHYLPETVTYPAISFFRVSDIKPRTKLGRTEQSWPRFQFDIWADRYSQAVEVELALMTAMDVIDTVEGIDYVEYAGCTELYEQDVKLHHFAVDYQILYRE